jgi:serine protease Do
MNQQIKTPKSVILTLVAGFGLGAITLAGLQSGVLTHKAYAQDVRSGIRMISGGTTESLAELHNLDGSFANLAEFVAPAVVDIRASSGRNMGPNGERMAVREGEGSGFIYRSDGYIMTNDHVVGGADKVKVTLKDGREFDGTVTRAQDNDIAIVKIQAKDLPVLGFSDSAKLRPGQLCMAVGAPFGLENSVTFGHISALGRDTQIGDHGEMGPGALSERYYPDLIQTDASINMGNSGGPLVNVDGQVVGVNTAIYSPSGTSAGIGFAIPSNQAKFIGDMLVQKGKVTRSVIGVWPVNLKEYEKKDKGLSGGAVINQVMPNTPAEKAGLKKGDIIVKIGSSPITSQLDVRNAMLVYAPGTKVPVEIIRDGRNMTVDVTLEKYEAPAPQPTPQRMNGFDNGDGLKMFPKGFQSPDDLLKQFGKQFDNSQDDKTPQDVPSLHDGQAHLGVSVGTVTDTIRKENNIPAGVAGAFVADVQAGSVAAKLGMKAGDVITEFDGQSISTSEDLTRQIAKVKWGESHRIKFARYGNGSQVLQDVTVTFK